jgi:hypothetical protein
MQERDEEPKESVVKPVMETISPLQRPAKAFEYAAYNIRQSLKVQSFNIYTKPVIVVMIIMFFVFLGAMGHRLFSSGGPTGSAALAVKEPEKPKVEALPATTPAPEQNSRQETAAEKTDTITPANQETGEAKSEKDLMGPYKEDTKPKTVRAAIVIVDGANVRSAPYLDSQRILTIVKGEVLTIADEKTDHAGMKWYKVLLYNNRDGWISDKVVTITMIK